MQNVNIPFTDLEKEALTGMASKIAKRNSVTQQYVRSIVNGTRRVRSDKSKAIYADLKQTASFLSRPVPPPPPGATKADGQF